MKTIIGVLLIVSGAALGVYMGIWWAFIGGIVAIIEHTREAGPVDAYVIAVNLAKIFLATPIGTVCGIIPFAIGMASLDD